MPEPKTLAEAVADLGEAIDGAIRYLRDQMAAAMDAAMEAQTREALGLPLDPYAGTPVSRHPFPPVRHKVIDGECRVVEP